MAYYIDEMKSMFYISQDSNDENHLFFQQDKRITLKTAQKWIYAEGHKSDLIRLQWTADRAKPAISWMDELGNDKTAIVSHHMANDPADPDHDHISIETTKADGTLHTRLEVTYGTDTANVRIHDANFICNGNPIYVGGEAGTYRDFVMATNTGDNTYLKRWSFRCLNGAESGSNAGSDFALTRYDDAGSALDSPFYINRRYRNIGFWTSSAFGGGSKVIGIQNRDVAPNANPATGGVLYAEAGALLWKGSSGTLTTIAPA